MTGIEPGYRIEWRAARRGTRSHVLIIDVHDQVVAALIDDPNGPPWTLEDVAQLATHVAATSYVRPERASDKRCQFCLHAIAELEAGIDLARYNWAIGQLAEVLNQLAEFAPIGPAEQVTGE